MWDSGWMGIINLENGIEDEGLVNWFLKKEIKVKGDWSYKKDFPPGGWAFQFNNKYYPDVDDTALVGMFLERYNRTKKNKSVKLAIERTRKWIVSMQSKNGGWGAFDIDNTNYYLNSIPFADHGALLDPPTADVSARCLSFLKQLNDPRDKLCIEKAIRYLTSEQEKNGSWYGRWGTNYIYGTWSVLCALNLVDFKNKEKVINKATKYLNEMQRVDGGWGEDGKSYYSNFKDGTFRLAKTYFSLRDFENAQKWCEETIYIDSTHVQSIKMLGDINKRGGNIDKAIELYRQAIGINVNYDRAYYSLGVALKDVGRYDEAIQALNKALLVNPTYTKAYETLGVVYQEDNDLDNAVFNFNKALDTDGKAYKVYSRLASVYNTQNKYEDARASAKACLKIKRNYAAAMCELGIAEMNMCNRVAAEDAFTKAKKDRNYRKFASDYLKNLDYYTRDCN